ncbi:hypothetical protein NFI96_012230, partial [Prochilodus magdalenae]
YTKGPDSFPFRMELDEALLTIPINPNNFPAKLWWLVNSPQNRSIRWDSNGEAVIIDQQLFEAELLSPGLRTSGKSPECFKTTNFTSFIRQLNLYGFRKLIPGAGSSDKQSKDEPDMDSILHHFHNPNFKQGHPELLVNLKRLTSSNKAKLAAGLEVTCQPPSRFQRFLLNSPEGKCTAKKKGSVLAGQGHQGRMNSSPYPHRSNSLPHLKEYNRTPIPSRAWIMGHDHASSSNYHTDKGVPLYVIHNVPGDLPCAVPPNSTNVQQVSQSTAAGGSKFGTIIHPQYQSGFYSPVAQRCPPGSLDLEMACSHQPPPLYPHYGYYTNYAAGYLHPSGQNPDSLSGENVSKKSDVNLDTVFKMVDEFQGPPRMHMVKVSSPEKRPITSSHLVGPSFNNPTACTSKPSSALTTAQHDMTSVSRPIHVDSSSMCPSFSSVPRGGIIITVPGNVSSDIAITMGPHSSRSEMGSHEGLEPGSTPKALPLESSQKRTTFLVVYEAAELLFRKDPGFQDLRFEEMGIVLEQRTGFT